MHFTKQLAHAPQKGQVSQKLKAEKRFQITRVNKHDNYTQ